MGGSTAFGSAQSFSLVAIDMPFDDKDSAIVYAFEYSS